VSGVLFYYCFGLYKIAVIVQQIYARYVRGHTRDERFARLNERVAALSCQALRAVESGRL
jgi:aminoglycoside phosphotransferase (APT) family kinase protein